MTTTYVGHLLARQHAADLLRLADTAQLAMLARCCRPSGWARAVAPLKGWAAGLAATARRGQVGGAACCAPA